MNQRIQALVEQATRGAMWPDRKEGPYIGDYIGEQMGYGEEHGIANWRHEG
jgi:hypothetical protein